MPDASNLIQKRCFYNLKNLLEEDPNPIDALVPRNNNNDGGVDGADSRNNKVILLLLSGVFFVALVLWVVVAVFFTSIKDFMLFVLRKPITAFVLCLVLCLFNYLTPFKFIYLFIIIISMGLAHTWYLETKNGHL